MTIDFGKLHDVDKSNDRWDGLAAQEREALATAYAEKGSAGLALAIRDMELTIPVNTVRGKLVRAGVRVGPATYEQRETRLTEFSLPDKVVRVLVVGDEQIPFHDPWLINRVHQFARDYNPHILVYLGDTIDCYTISSYDKDPRRHLTLHDELVRTRSYFEIWRHHLPDAHMLYTMGNHEQRLEKYLARHAPELADLPELELESLLGLEELGIQSVRYGRSIDFRGFTFTHGTAFGKDAARKQQREIGGSGISGHSHTADAYWTRDMRGEHGWYINSTLMRIDDVEPNYRHYTPDWTQGFTYIDFVDDMWTVTPVIAVEGHFIANGERY